MQILFPFVSDFPKAREALPYWADLVDVGGSRWDYWNAIVSRWGQDDLLIVEQDIVLGPFFSRGFRYCPKPWCLHPYQVNATEGIDWALGCTRFSRELMRTVPIEAISAVPTPGICEYCGSSGKCWMHIDHAVFWALTEAGYDRCIHSPWAEHLRVTPSASLKMMLPIPRP